MMAGLTRRPSEDGEGLASALEDEPRGGGRI